MAADSKRRRRYFVPEVIQTSAMDCGPATLHCLLKGFALPSSYARLQEACQVDLDGTSINTIEQIAVSLGLDAEQVMLPVDHVTLPAAQALPALVVVEREAMLHFMIAWRRHGRFVQVMDPARGRRWLPIATLESELHVHAQRVPAAGWREWAGSDESINALRQRLEALAIRRSAIDALLAAAQADAEWRSLAALDATVRLASDLASRGRIRRGREAAELIAGLLKNDRDEWDQPSLLPPMYWSVLPDPASDEHLILRGAVLVRVRGAQPMTSAAPEAEGDLEPAVPSSFAAALSEPPERPFADVWRMIRTHGALSPLLLIGAAALAATAAVFELLLLRGMLEWNQILSLREQRLVAVAVLVGVMGALILLDAAISDGIFRLGRRVETRLRALLLEKLPRLSDRYFRSRLISDMALRAHTLEDLRALPDLAVRLCRLAVQLVVTAAGLTWLDLKSGAIAWVAVALALVVPLAMQRLLAERDLRLRVHGAALSRYYLDSLIGLIAARTHGAERALRRRHESRLVEWGRAGLHLLRGGVAVEALQLLGGLILAAWIVLDFVGRGGPPGAVLLVVYWALSLPTLGRELASLLRTVPAYRNVIARVAEILNAPEEPNRPLSTEEQTAGGVAIEMLEVCVRAGGKAVLDDINLQIASGEHIAIVGRSGAGKSSLAGLLLGWNEASRGCVLVDGNVLDPSTVVALRSRTAWVDPGVQLWNRSLVENIRYSDPGVSIWNLGPALEQADLVEVLDRLPGGLQATLGEGGGLTSGGEGQRVRFARALLRKDARLVILDEPFRGLDRDRRRALLERARDLWRGATTICITHDIEDTLAFDRVVVLNEGTVVEDGHPQRLRLAPGSLYRTLLDAEREIRAGLESGEEWRRWRIENGAIVEETRPVDDGLVVHEFVRSEITKAAPPTIARPVEVPKRQRGPAIITAAQADAADEFEPELPAAPARVVARIEPVVVAPQPAVVPQPALAQPSPAIERPAGTTEHVRKVAAAAAVLLAVGVTLWLGREVAVPESGPVVPHVSSAPVPVQQPMRAAPSVTPSPAAVSTTPEVRPSSVAAAAPSQVEVHAPSGNDVRAPSGNDARIASEQPRARATEGSSREPVATAMARPAVGQQVAPVVPSPLPLALATLPSAALSVPATFRAPDLATRAELTATPIPASVAMGRGRISDDTAIRQVLFQYERSYDRLDAASAAAVWRGVDVRGLTRAFASLSSQDLSFENCDVRVDGGRATAQCRGALKFVRRIGDPEPEERRVSWTIGFENDEGRWLIANVNAR